MEALYPQGLKEGEAQYNMELWRHMEQELVQANKNLERVQATGEEP